MFAKLLRDESGLVNVSTYLLMMTVIAIGMIAGLTALRDSVVQQLGDVALGLEHLDQTYTINATFGTQVKMYGYQDAPAPNDPVGQGPEDIAVGLPATPE